MLASSDLVGQQLCRMRCIGNRKSAGWRCATIRAQGFRATSNKKQDDRMLA
jgi:hypothetical protein